MTEPGDIPAGGAASAEPPDIELMLRARQGDVPAFERLYHRYAGPLTHYFYRLAGDAAIAEDWLHDVFVKLWRHAPRYQATGKFSTYLFQIARHHWLNERDKIARRPAHVSLEKKKTGMTPRWRTPPRRSRAGAWSWMSWTGPSARRWRICRTRCWKPSRSPSSSA